MSNVTDVDMTAVKIVLVTGTPHEVCKAAIQAGLIAINNPGLTDWRLAAQAVNGIAVMAGRKGSDIFANDVQKAYHEVSDRMMSSVISKARPVPEESEKIVLGTGLEAVVTIIKGCLVPVSFIGVMRTGDHEAIAEAMNTIAGRHGRKELNIHKTDVAAALTQIYLGITPEALKKKPSHPLLEKPLTWGTPMHARTEELRDEIIRDYSHFWELNDEGHRVEHFDGVYKCGIYLNNLIGVKYSQQVILMAAFFHDLFAWSRKNHHLMSADWIRTTDFPILRHFTDEERELIAIGCSEHRASRKEPFTHEFGELISSADRGFPTGAQELLMRALASRSKTDEDDATKRVRAIAHLKEKFGDGGYARYPDMYRKAFAEELARQSQEVMTLV